MSNSFPQTEHVKLRLQNVRDIIVTEIVNDDGTYSRSIRFLGLPLDGGNPVETMEIVVQSDNAASDIDLTTPPLKF
ncbi:MAG: hypothetical protein JJ902_05505 [Roseibium sp.]|nr:hypothetical protein [Roseibium sp.]